MKKCLLMCVAAFLAVLAGAGPSQATNGHQLSAIGAYQQSMGGAVTAAPYDASTSIANPAGMALIGNRTDFSFDVFLPKRETEFAGGGTTENGSPFYLVPAIGWSAPANDANDVFFGGGMYGVSGLGVDYDIVSVPFMAGMMGWGGGAQAHIWSQYQFWKMAPTLAWKWDTVALGVALNLDYQAFGFKQMFTEVGGTGKFGYDLSQMQAAVGGGATVGIIYRPVSAFTVGLSYASRQYFTDFKWNLPQGSVIDFDAMGNPVVNQDGTYRMRLDFPQQAAFGIAVRLARPVLWTADVKWINYSDTYDIVKLKGNFTGGATEVVLPFGWDDVWVYATGLQFDITPNFVLRLGYNHSNSPIEEDDVIYNIAFPAVVEDRVSGGFTYRFGRNWEMTMAYMKAFKNELTDEFGTGTKLSLEESSVDMQVSYRF